MHQVHWMLEIKHFIITTVSNILVLMQATKFAENKEPSWLATDKTDKLK